MIERRGGARFSLEAPRPVGILCELSRQQLDAKPTPEQRRRFSSGLRIIFYGPVDDEFGISYVYAAVECLLFDTDTTRGDPCFPPGQKAARQQTQANKGTTRLNWKLTK